MCMQAHIRHPWTEDLPGKPTDVPMACVLPSNEFVESVQKYASAYLSPQPLEKEQHGFARKLGEALGECFRNICTRPGNPKGIWSKRSVASCILGHRVIAEVFSGSYLLMVKSTSEQVGGQESIWRR